MEVVEGMTFARIAVGKRGEDFAAAYLMARGFRVLARNFLTRYGEIDLVVARGTDLRFVEVKTRMTHQYGYPEEAVTRLKLHHLMRASEIWLSKSRQAWKRYQMDVIAIDLSKANQVETSWIEGV